MSWSLRQRIRDFTDQQIRPDIAEWYDHGVFPLHLPAQLGELGVLGMHLEGYGCPGRSAVEYGLAAMELEAGDSGIRTFVSVQGSLAMTAIHKWGSEDQKQEWLPRMAAGEVIGCFALTEPTAGSDPSSMATFARQDGTGEDAGWILDGAKRWIGLASIADVMVVWARTDDGVRGFLVPAGTAGRHRHAHRAETVDARLRPVRRDVRRRPAGTGGAAARRARTQRTVLLPERGPVRHRVGSDGRGPRLLRGGPELFGGAAAVRQAAGRATSSRRRSW